MPSTFTQKKAKILEALQVPDEEYTDLSPKGSVDAGVRELCDEINRQDEYVTTSSCAGRISVFLDGPPKDTTETESDVLGAGGKGGGRWLYVSHDPLDSSEYGDEGALYSLFGISGDKDIWYPSLSSTSRLVHFKFEPMILHILSSSTTNAQHALKAAMTAGFRESGISSIIPNPAQPDPTPLVAVRTQGLALESIIAYYDPATDTVRPMVTEQYLRMLVQLANQRFHTNTERKERFWHALLADKATDGYQREVDWEPASVRAGRKRAEGLRRREEQKRQQASGSTEACEHEDVSLHMGLLPAQ